MLTPYQHVFSSPVELDTSMIFLGIGLPMEDQATAWVPSASSRVAPRCKLKTYGLGATLVDQRGAWLKPSAKLEGTTSRAVEDAIPIFTASTRGAVKNHGPSFSVLPTAGFP
jgi:hypothetical protein